MRWNGRRRGTNCGKNGKLVEPKTAGKKIHKKGMTVMTERQSGAAAKHVLLGTAVGSVLGAVTALLLAPKSGKELRSDISEQIHKIGEKTERLASAVSSKTQNIARQIQGWIPSRTADTSEQPDGGEMMPADADVLVQSEADQQV